MKTGKFNIFQYHVLACCLILTTTAVAQSQENYCQPSASLKEELKKIPEFYDDESRYGSYQKRPIAALEALAKKYPNDVYIQKRLADARRHDEKTDHEALIGEYRALMERHPDDPTATYLYAHLMVGRDTKEAIAKLNKLAAQFPDFPWTYLDLGNIYYFPAFNDQAKSKENLKKWVAKCPSSLENILFFYRGGDQELMRDALRRLRNRLDSSPEQGELTYYGHLWSLEFKVSPVTEHAQVRQRVAEEVKELREKNIGGKEWLIALASGYRLTGDTQGRRWAEDEMLRLFPNLGHSRSLAQVRFHEEHPRPLPRESDKWKSYNRAVVKATGDWLELWPDDMTTWQMRFSALCELGDEIANSSLEAEAESLLKSLEKNEGFRPLNSPFQTKIAIEYARRKIATERIPALVLKGIGVMEKLDKQKEDVNDLYPPPIPGAVPYHGLTERIRMWSWPVLAESYARLRQFEKAHQTLAQMAEALNIGKMDAKGNQSVKSGNVYDRMRYWQAIAVVAECESRKRDALTAYLTALSSITKSDQPAPSGFDELIGQARRLWKEVGGTEEGWKSYLVNNEISRGATEIVSGGTWNSPNTVLPEFALTDLTGKKWQLADLKGRIVFINFWAVGNPVSTRELPWVQRLQEKVKDSEEILVLTFNIDFDLGIIEPFIKEKKYDFPVILAKAFVESQQVRGIPRNWVINRDGVLQFDWFGFHDTEEEWMKKVMWMIEKLKSGIEAKK